MKDVFALREKIIGLGETSMKKSYYPDLQKRLEELNRFRALINAVSDILIIIKVDDLKILDVNDATCDFFNIKYNQMTKKTLNDLIEIPFFIFIRDMLMSNIDKNRQFTQTGLETNFVVKTESDEFTYLDISIKSCVFDGIEYAIVIAKKANERIRMLKQLQESERKYRDLVEFLPIVFFEMDNYGRLTYINPYGIEKFGYTEEDLNKLSVVDIVFPDDREKAMRNMQRRLRGEDFVSEEYRLLTKDGVIIHALIESRPIFKENKVVGLRGVAIDITERKGLRQNDVIDTQRYQCLNLANTNVKDLANILLVGDDGIITKLLEIISNLGHKAFCCKGKDEVRKIYEDAFKTEGNFDLVILSCDTLSTNDVIDISNTLKKINPEVKIIITGMNASNDLIVYPERHGFYGGLLKPTNIFEVESIISDILKTK
ncbi:MAG: PAS domain S-box protein [Thermodesulfovibrionales bacterium]|nr:PAS domain S-box protein [Thermodesulfovibrionales bacterium]